MIPTSAAEGYDITTVIDALVDEDSFFEVKPLFAPELVVGLARLEGQSVGIVANNPAVKGGVLFVDSADKGGPLHLVLRRVQHPAGVPVRRPRIHDRQPGRAAGNHPPRGQDGHRGVGGDGAQGVGDHPQGVRGGAVCHVRTGVRARCLPRAAVGPDRGDGPRGGHQRRVRQQDRRDRRCRRAERYVAERRAEYEADVDLLRLASDLVIDAVVQPESLRAELVARLQMAGGKDRTFSERHHGVPRYEPAGGGDDPGGRTPGRAAGRGSPSRSNDRVALIEALVAAGVRPDRGGRVRVAQGGAGDGRGGRGAGARSTRVPGVTYWALVPNLRGAEMAIDAGVDGLTVTVSASEAYSEKNVHMSVDQSVAEAARIAELAGGAVPVDAVISCAFGSPYEGDLDPAAVAALGDRLLEGGATSLTYADTTGMGTPRRVADLLAETGPEVGLHLHETRGTAMVNAYAALEAGVARFDTSVGGLGGSPFAAGAGGNLATEDLVHLLDDLGRRPRASTSSGCWPPARCWPRRSGTPVPSRVAAAGPRWRRAVS